jgi:hypothetical protein
MRLDEEKLEALRTWGEALRQARGEELAATGRAIVMLVEEIDQLHVDLWHARLEDGGEPAASEETSSDEDEDELVDSSLHARLRRALRVHRDTA